MPSEYIQKPDLVPALENPFIKDLVYPKGGGTMKTGNKSMPIGGNAASWVSKKMGLVDKDSGEVIDDQVVMRTVKTVDKEHFVKVFEAGLGAIFNLSKRAQEVLHFMLKVYNAQALGGEQDQLSFSFEEAQLAGYSRKRQTWRSGMNELMYQEFMVPARRGNDWYWINPTLFYRGDRVTIVNQFVKKKESQTKALEAEAEAKTVDVELDQIDMFSGKTKRQENEEK